MTSKICKFRDVSDIYIIYMRQITKFKREKQNSKWAHWPRCLWTSVHASPFLKDLLSLASGKWPGGGAIWVPWHFIHLSVISVLGPGQWQPDSPGASGVKSNYIHYLKEVRSLTFSVHNKTSMNTLHGHRVVSQANQCHCPTRKIICIDILQPLTNKIYLFLFYVCVCLHIFKCTCMQCP